jgi:hypothetical protein
MPADDKPPEDDRPGEHNRPGEPEPEREPDRGADGLPGWTWAGQPGPGGQPGQGAAGRGEPDPGSGGGPGCGPAEGLSWSYELDLEALLSAIGVTRAGDPAELDDPSDQEASLAAELALVEAEDSTSRDLTGVIADHLPAGPGLAAWLSNARPGELSDWDLPGIAAAYRRVASWAQAGELATVAAIASRTAARDEKIGIDDEGRPADVTPSAASEVSLALTMSQFGATWWTHLAVVLGWRLRATGAALAAGAIDLARARLIAEATSPLDDDTARAVEAMVLPSAGEKTTGQLRAALRRAVITADPKGADERRRAAELRAKFSLYPDDSGTATLVNSGVPAVDAAAAFARVSALAWAMKAAGSGGGIDFLRSQVSLGLLLGTLPLIPPPADDPPRDGPPADDPPRDGPPADGPPADGPPADGPPAGDPDGDVRPGNGPPGLPPDPGPDPGARPHSRPGPDRGGRGPSDRPDSDRPDSDRPDSDRPDLDRPSSGPGDPPDPGSPADPGRSPADPGRSPDARAGHREAPGRPPPDQPGGHPPRPLLARGNRGRAGSGPDHGGSGCGGPVRDGPGTTGASPPPASPDQPASPDRPGSLDQLASPDQLGSMSGLRDLPSPEAGSGQHGPSDPSDRSDRSDPSGPWLDIPPPGDDDGPDDDDPGDAELPSETLGFSSDQDDEFDAYGTVQSPGPAWPPLPATISQVPPVLGCPPPAPGRPVADPDRASPLSSRAAGPDRRGGARRPPRGLLDLTMPWSTLAGASQSAAWLGRIGPITAPQALPLAGIAALDPYAQWRVILTGPDGQALAVERVRRRGRQPGRPPGVVGRVTVTVPVSVLGDPRSGCPAGGEDRPTGSDGSQAEGHRAEGHRAEGHGIRVAVLRTARRAAARAAATRAADVAAPGGCAHTTASSAYRPPPRIREYVEARDQTCRQPCCRQPAWRADLDHTLAWHKGGPTRPCNLGAECRTHHRVKQQPGWKLTQPRPGYFELTTPAGRSYPTSPGTYPA